MVRQADRGRHHWGEEYRSGARRQALRGADARRGVQGNARGAEPRRLPPKLLRRATAQSAHGQVTSSRQQPPESLNNPILKWVDGTGNGFSPTRKWTEERS